MMLKAGAERKRKDDEKKEGNKSKKVDYDYHFVWWNAWLYSGSDNLWAGLIKALHEAVEDRYGAPYARARRDAMVVSVGIQLVFAVGLLIFALAFGITSFDVDSLAEEGANSLDGVFTVLFTTAGSLGVGFSALCQYMTNPLPSSARLVDDAASGAIRRKLGFMHTIKQELEKIGEMLNNPSGKVPNCLDYLLPKWLLQGRSDAYGDEKGEGDGKKWLLESSLYSWLAWLFGVEVLKLKPCRLVIYIDDLDRCPPEKSVEVLQSLVLLTEGTPFIIFLAIDPRIVVTAIETSNTRFFGDAGINGHEYLDKIVQIPFAIPQLADNEKAMLCKGYLTGQGNKKSVGDVPLEGMQLWLDAQDGTSMALEGNGVREWRSKDRCPEQRGLTDPRLRSNGLPRLESKYVQTAAGGVPSVFFSRDETSQIKPAFQRVVTIISVASFSSKHKDDSYVKNDKDDWQTYFFTGDAQSPFHGELKGERMEITSGHGSWAGGETFYNGHIRINGAEAKPILGTTCDEIGLDNAVGMAVATCTAPVTNSKGMNRIGRDRDGGPHGKGYHEYRGHICELLVYDRALSEDEIETIESYLSSKWQLDTP